MCAAIDCNPLQMRLSFTNCAFEALLLFSQLSKQSTIACWPQFILNTDFNQKQHKSICVQWSSRKCLSHTYAPHAPLCEWVWPVTSGKQGVQTSSNISFVCLSFNENYVHNSNGNKLYFHYDFFRYCCSGYCFPSPGSTCSFHHIRNDGVKLMRKIPDGRIDGSLPSNKNRKQANNILENERMS